MTNLIERWKDKILHYVEVRLKLIGINLIERTSSIVSQMLFTMIGIFFFFAILIFLGFGLAEWFTVICNGSRIAGYFMTIAAYIILFIMLIALRKPITKGFASIFIRILTEDNEEKGIDKKENN